LLHDIVNQMLEFLTGLGYWGIVLGLVVEVIPSEIVLAYAGYLVHTGKINFFEAVLFGTIGAVLQQLILYWIGRYGGRPLLDRIAKYIHLKQKHIDTAERWFDKYGSGVVFTARFVPVLRQAISIPAGMAKMSHTRFILLTASASVIWAVIFVSLGKTLGENWKDIQHSAGPLMTYFIVAAIGLTAIYFIYKILARRRRA
jgi:membrane protein DedA with SNARE-associated domain